MKVFYWRIDDHENVIARFNNYDRKMKFNLIQKRQVIKSYAERSMITSACGRCLSKCYLLLPCCSNFDSSRRNGRSIDELICSDCDWKQTDWTQLLPFYWYSQELICIRKTKFHNHSVYIYIFSKFLAHDNDFPAFWLVPWAHDMSHYR